MEQQLKFVQCLSPRIKEAHVQRRSAFKEVHKQLRTATVIYGALHGIFNSLRSGDEPMALILHFESEFDRMVTRAWREQ